MTIESKLFIDEQGEVQRGEKEKQFLIKDSLEILKNFEQNLKENRFVGFLDLKSFAQSLEGQTDAH